MAGLVIPVFPMRTFDFSWLAANSSTAFVAKRGIDVSQWIAVSLLVRVSSSVMPNGAIVVSVLQEGPTSDDPGNDFVGSGGGLVNISDGIAPKALTSVPYFDAMGASARIVIQGDRFFAGGTIASMFSVDLVVRNGR